MNCDPNALSQASACFSCANPPTLQAIKTFLLCQWANKGTPPIIPAIGYTIVSSFGWENGTLSNSTSYLFGGDLFNSIQLGQSGIGSFFASSVYVPFSGTIKRLFVKMRNLTAGSGETVSHFFTLNNNINVAQIDFAYNAGEAHGTNSTVSQATVQGDQMCFKVTTPAWVTAPTGVRLWTCAYIEP